MEFLNDLNSVQREAATQISGPVMIIAGAGSGKTRVLTYRVAYLLNQGIDPFRILALTFTNKAAREMKDRIGSLINESYARQLWMGTFHSVFARILRVEADKIGYPKQFTIYDTEDSKSVLKSIVKEMQLDDKIYKPSLILHRISDAKNKLINAAQYQQNPVNFTEDSQSKKPLLGQIYALYEKRNFKAGAMDFDDLLFQTNLLLRDFPEVLHKYQDQFRYIMVDEYQDTNFSQYLIIKQLAARFENLCVVGDDAQSIYAFRGANIQNILNFKKDYPEAKLFKLEENYRSTVTIVEAANALIANNQDQITKHVFTQNDTGSPIILQRCASDSEEGQQIAHKIQDYYKNGVLYDQIAVLYRTNAQSRAFEEWLRRLQIPYKIYGGISFYQRKEIKDVLAYFRLCINPNDNESLKRIINYPARGIGQSTLDRIFLTASEQDLSLWTVVSNLQDFQTGISKGICDKIDAFCIKIKSFQAQLETQSAFDLGQHIMVSSGIIPELYADKSAEGIARYENIQELLNGLKDFSENSNSDSEDSPTTKNLTLSEFVQDITLLTGTDINDASDDGSPKVSLMTVHAAKGLEYGYVCIVGMEENLFPSQLSLNSRQDLEEERRLFYVALTRAKKQILLSYAATRFRYGSLHYSEPSRFIDELPNNFIERTLNNSTQPLLKPTLQSRAIGHVLDSESSNQKKLVRVSSHLKPKSNAPINIEFNRQLSNGDLVVHETFGTGTVLNIIGVWPDSKAEINFNPGGVKTLLLKFARLKPSDKIG